MGVEHDLVPAQSETLEDRAAPFLLGPCNLVVGLGVPVMSGAGQSDVVTGPRSAAPDVAAPLRR